MAAPTRITVDPTPAPTNDVLAGVSLDRQYLRLALIYTPSVDTGRPNALGQPQYDGVAPSYSTQITEAAQLAEMEQQAVTYHVEATLRAMGETRTAEEIATIVQARLAAGEGHDWAQTQVGYDHRAACLDDWDARVAAYENAHAAWEAEDPETRGAEPMPPTVQEIDQQFSCRWSGNHPFVYHP